MIKNFVLVTTVVLLLKAEFRICESSKSQEGWSLHCKPPDKGIKEPLHAHRRPPSLLFKHWKLDSMVSYTCPMGYKFPDDHHVKTSACLLNRFHSPEWQPKKFYDCIPYCGTCENGGRCVVKYNSEQKLQFQCLCPEHFTGDRCQFAKCRFPPLVPFSRMEVVQLKRRITDLFVEGSQILYTCRRRYQMLGRNRLTCRNGEYVYEPPKCLQSGFPNPFQCTNQFVDLEQSKNKMKLLGKSRVLPYYNLRRDRYQLGDKITFTCPPGYRIEGQAGASSLFTQCSKGKWTLDWPICKAKRCEEPLVKNAVIISSESKSTIQVKCLDGYYIFESSISEYKCMSYGYWNPTPPDCITRNVYKNKCLLKGRVTRYTPEGKPYCSDVSLIKKEQSQNELNAITIVTASAAAIFGVLLLIVLIMALQRRRLLHRIRRQAEMDAETEHTEMSPYEAMIHFILPTYDEAVRTKPTASPPSFEEALQDYNHESDNENENERAGEDIDEIYISQRGMAREPTPSTSSDTTVSTLVIDNHMDNHVDSPPSYDEANETGETLVSFHDD